MSVRMDERVARCFTLLRGPEFTAFRGYLEALRQEQFEAMAIAQDAVMIHRAQGQTIVIKKLLDSLAESENILNKLQKR